MSALLLITHRNTVLFPSIDSNQDLNVVFYEKLRFPAECG